MRRLLFGLVAIFAFVATSCEKSATAVDGPTQLEPKLVLTSDDKLRVGSEAGEYTITYTLENPAEGVEIKTTVVNAAMITATDASVAGAVKVSISENTTDAVREGAVVVTYGAQSFTVVVYQDFNSGGEDPVQRVDIEANQLVGMYYGDNLAAGVGHYWIILTKDGFVDGAAVPGGEYFRLDVLAPMASNTDHIKLPDGDYRFDLSISFEPYTIVDIGNTDYSWVDEDMEGYALPLADASLSVKGNRLELMVFVNSTEYHISYEGDYSLNEVTINDYVSSLTHDTVVDVSNCTASVSSYGDYWECGYNNWCVEFVCNDGFTQGTYLVLDLLSSSTSDFTGTYVASGFCADDPTKPDFRHGVFVPGFRLSPDADLLLGSLFMVYNNGLCVSQAPLYEGTITITANNDGTHTIVVDALDDAPEQHRITLSWTGNF